ncbi:MAG: GNAT family N-acetyltransferase [Cruoricaptor ignavus]|nr:GNAT family N-acetyltransferase [Cruoricaptor ignavus]
MNIKALDWDSEFFGLKVGELIINSNEGIFEVSENYDVIYTKQNEDFYFEIVDYSRSFQETKIIFIKTISEKNIFNESEIKDYDELPLPNEVFYEVGYVSGNHSRFLLDEKFGEEKFRSLYRMWVDNSMNKKFAKKIFYTEEEGLVTGFVTYQEYDGVGKIGLIATLPSHQGKGLGKKILWNVENYCLENGIEILEIPTQKENTQACGFYKFCGYRIKEEQIIKHYWRK